LNTKPEVVAEQLFITYVPFVKILAFEILNLWEYNIPMIVRGIPSGRRNPGVVFIVYSDIKASSTR